MASPPSPEAIARAVALPADTSTIGDYLMAAHDPALGPARSVCLRDVLEFCRSFQSGDAAHAVASVIEREFT